jgi:hypothetical protein
VNQQPPMHQLAVLSVNQQHIQVRGPASSAALLPLQLQTRWLYSHCCSSFKCVGFAPVSTTLELWRKLGSELKIKWEVGRKENFWGREKVEKTNNFGQGGCVFGSSPKWFQRPHPQLEHWRLLVHSGQVNGGLDWWVLMPFAPSVVPSLARLAQAPIQGAP